MKKTLLLFVTVIFMTATLFAQGKNQMKSVKLNSGYEMPLAGFGTWSLSDTEAENCTYEAIKAGCRLIDTAKYYGTEKGVGRGVRRAIEEGLVTREEIFVTSKVTPWGYSDYDKAISECNDAIGLGYIDLMLVHQQGSDEKKLYEAMERSVQKGIVRSLGISNYYTERDVKRVLSFAKIKPCVIQNENHIFYQNNALRDWCKSEDIVIESYYPLGGRGHTKGSLNNKTILEIARAHKKSAAQIILRWHLQSLYIAIPGSANAEHIRENCAVWDFELTADEMKMIGFLDTGRRYENW